MEGGHQGGSAILSRLDVPYTTISLNTTLQAVAVQIYLEKTYTVCSIYLPPNEDIPRSRIESLLNELPRPFLLLGDVNARHYLWGDTTRNRRGDIFHSLLEDDNIYLLNSGEPTHLHTQTGSLTAIDLSICSTEIAPDFTWEVGCSTRGSDHYPITIRTIFSEPQQRPPKWCLHRADWTSFQRACNFDRSVDDFGTVDEAVDYFVARLHYAASLSIPRTSGTFRRRPVPWWNERCAAARNASRRAEKRYKRVPSSEALKITFLGARARYRKVLKDSRRESWRTYVSSINSNTPIDEVWQRIRKMKGKYKPHSPPVIKIEGQLVTNQLIVANHFADFFSSVPRQREDTSASRRRLREENRVIEFPSGDGKVYNVLFDSREMSEAMKTCNDTTPGPDDIPYAMLRYPICNAA